MMIGKTHCSDKTRKYEEIKFEIEFSFNFLLYLTIKRNKSIVALLESVGK